MPSALASLAQLQDGYALKAWTHNDRGHILYHNDLMTACRVTLAQVSEKRARFFEGRAAKAPRAADGAVLEAPGAVADGAVDGAADPAAASSLQRADGNVTPPQGR